MHLVDPSDAFARATRRLQEFLRPLRADRRFT